MVGGEQIYDAQAESGVIASLLYDPELIIHSDFLSPDAFYDPVSSAIYFAIRCLYDNDQSIDSFSISQEIKTNPAIKGSMDAVNIPSIDELKDLGQYLKRSRPEDYIELAKEVMSNAYKRKMVASLQSIISECYDRKKTVEDINSAAYEVIDTLAQQYIISDDLVEMGDKVDALWAKIEERRKDVIDSKLQWRWDCLNEIAELERGEMYLVEADAKIGKSIFLMETGLDLANRGIPTLIVDTEMTDDLYFRRMLTFLSGVDGKRIKHGDMTEEEARKVEAAKQWIKEHHIWHEYIPEWNKTKLYSICRIAKEKKDVPVLVYDYLKCDNGDSSLIYHKLGEMATHLKNTIAGKLDMCVLTAGQLNRSGEVSDSTKLEKYTSVAMKIFPKSPEEIEADGIECGNCKVIVHRNRLGQSHNLKDPKDYFDFQRDGARMRFEEAKQHTTATPFD